MKKLTLAEDGIQTTKELLKEIKMFGMSLDEVKRGEEFKIDSQYDDLFYAFCILSDAQQVLESDPEVARQFINKAKYWIGKVQDEIREGESK